MRIRGSWVRVRDLSTFFPPDEELQTHGNTRNHSSARCHIGDSARKPHWSAAHGPRMPQPAAQAGACSIASLGDNAVEEAPGWSKRQCAAVDCTDAHLGANALEGPARKETRQCVINHGKWGACSRPMERAPRPPGACSSGWRALHRPTRESLQPAVSLSARTHAPRAGHTTSRNACTPKC